MTQEQQTPDTNAEDILEGSIRTVELSRKGRDGKPLTVTVQALDPETIRAYNEDERIPMAKLRAIREVKARGEEPGDELALTEEESAKMAAAMEEMVRLACIKPRCYKTYAEAKANGGITLASLRLDFLRISEAVTELAYGTEEERQAAARFRTQ